MSRLTHGHNRKGMRSPTYRTWAAMLTRCENPRAINFHSYGGRGIRVCPEWHDFATFLSDMGERPENKTLDRRDNDGDYRPDNCRWATRKEQMGNKPVKTRCPHGHEYNDLNAYRNRQGSWVCRVCDRARPLRPRKKVLA